MSDKLRLAVDQCPADLAAGDARLDWLKQTLSRAGQKLDLLVLPELFQCGYNAGKQINSRAEAPDGEFSAAVAELARHYATAIIYGYAERQGEHLFNSAQCVSASGEIIGQHRKLLLPPGFEGDHFQPGNACQVFQLGAFKVAILICYDVEFPENLRHVAGQGADLVVVPTALANQWGVVADKLVPARAFENGVFLCYANYCGRDNGLAFLGGSCIISPSGEELARGGHNSELLLADICVAEVQQARERLPYQKDCQRLPWHFEAESS